MAVGPLAFVFLLVLGPAQSIAEPIKVRLKEGASRGFLVMSPPGGSPIAFGELRQKPVGNAIESRLVLQFHDGSLFDETVTFTQAGVFRLEAYRHLQQGPSLPTAVISFDRKSGQYQARTQEKRGGVPRSHRDTVPLSATIPRLPSPITRLSLPTQTIKPPPRSRTPWGRLAAALRHP